jgi:hypothetical protein
LRKLIAQGLGTDDLHVANKIVERDKTTGKIHDYDMLTRARFAVMRPNEREVFTCLLRERRSKRLPASWASIKPPRNSIALPSIAKWTWHRSSTSPCWGRYSASPTARTQQGSTPTTPARLSGLRD